MSFTTTVNDAMTALEAFPEKLAAEISSLPKEALLDKPNGKWSIQEHAGHLLSIESLWIARLDDFMLRHETMRAWNGTNEETDQAQFNFQTLSSILRDFSEVREAHCRMVRLSIGKLADWQCLHPTTGESVTFEQHLLTMAEHDEQHLQIIKARFV
jgi:hypothetical protein